MSTILPGKNSFCNATNIKFFESLSNLSEPFVWDKCAKLASILSKLSEDDFSVFSRNRNRLHLAAATGDLKGVEAFVRQYKREGHDINKKDDNNKTALMYAINYDQDHVVSWLLKNDAHVNIKDRRGYTALHYAVERGSTSNIKQLIHWGADINALTNENNTVALLAPNFDIVCDLYHFAMKFNNCAYVKGILHKLALLDDIKTTRDFNVVDSIIKHNKKYIDEKIEDITPLDIAIQQMRPNLVHKLLAFTPRLLKNYELVEPNDEEEDAYESKRVAIGRDIILYGGVKHVNGIIFTTDFKIKIHKYIICCRYDKLAKEALITIDDWEVFDADGNSSLLYAAVRPDVLLVDYMLKSAIRILSRNKYKKNACQYVDHILQRKELSPNKRKNYSLIKHKLYFRAQAIQHVLNRLKTDSGYFSEEIKEYIKSFC